MADAPTKEELASHKAFDTEYIQLLLGCLVQESLRDEDQSFFVATSDGQSLSNFNNESSLWTTYQKDEKELSVRLLFPGGKQVARDFFAGRLNRQLESATTADASLNLSSNLVCFLSEKKSISDRCEKYDDVVRDCWAADAEIVENLNPAVIVAYATGEVEVGGDWGNIVLFHDGHSADSDLMLDAGSLATATVTHENDSNNAGTNTDDDRAGSKPTVAVCPHLAAATTASEGVSCPRQQQHQKAAHTAQSHNVHGVAIQDISPWYYDLVRIHRVEVTPRLVQPGVDGSGTNNVHFDVKFVRTISMRFRSVTVPLADCENDKQANSIYSSITVDGAAKHSVLTSRKIITCMIERMEQME